MWVTGPLDGRKGNAKAGRDRAWLSQAVPTGDEGRNIDSILKCQHWSRMERWFSWDSELKGRVGFRSGTI